MTAETEGTARAGSLTFVGTGIEFASQLTPLASSAIAGADDVPYLVSDSATVALIRSLNPAARSIACLYRAGAPRRESYEAMVEDLLASARLGRRVVAVLYGHPGVYVYPSHETIRRARAEGLRAKMLPAISSEACLIADLGVDPGSTGWQSYEATDFVVNRRRIDPTAALVLWQVGALGVRTYPVPESTSERRAVLVEVLSEWYSGDHELVVYEASSYAVSPPRMTRISLRELEETQLSSASTLYIAPARVPEPDLSVAARLGL